MLARSEEEFDIFQKIDLQRSQELASFSPDPNHPLPPLMVQEELPSWIIKNDDEIDRLTADPDDEKTFGRGSRAHKDVDYSDGFTEKQWLKAVDDGTLDELEDNSRPGKRKRNKDEDARDSDVEDVAAPSASLPKKRRGAPKAPVPEQVNELERRS